MNDDSLTDPTALFTRPSRGGALLLQPPDRGVRALLADDDDAAGSSASPRAGRMLRPRSAAELRSEVLAALRSEPRLERSTIGVLTLEGVVILSGYAATEAEAALAERIARRVRGVDSVIRHLRVRERASGSPAVQGARPATPF